MAQRLKINISYEKYYRVSKKIFVKKNNLNINGSGRPKYLHSPWQLYWFVVTKIQKAAAPKLANE